MSWLVAIRWTGLETLETYFLLIAINYATNSD